MVDAAAPPRDNLRRALLRGGAYGALTRRIVAGGRDRGLDDRVMVDERRPASGYAIRPCSAGAAPDRLSGWAPVGVAERGRYPLLVHAGRRAAAGGAAARVRRVASGAVAGRPARRRERSWRR